MWLLLLCADRPHIRAGRTSGAIDHPVPEGWHRASGGVVEVARAVRRATVTGDDVAGGVAAASQADATASDPLPRGALRVTVEVVGTGAELRHGRANDRGT